MKKELDDLRTIREMMEKSTKFLSLSGLSGVFAGLLAMAGAAFAYYIINTNTELETNRLETLFILLGDALVVLALSVACALFFSKRKAKRDNQKLFNKATFNTLYNLCIPLFTGGLLALILLWRGQVLLIAPCTLIFYGLALINASKYTYAEIHYLGITEIGIGLLSALLPYNGLLFWTIGFGICHIVYGTIMYIKYDLKRND